MVTSWRNGLTRFVEHGRHSSSASSWRITSGATSMTVDVRFVHVGFVHVDVAPRGHNDRAAGDDWLLIKCDKCLNLLSLLIGFGVFNSL